MSGKIITEWSERDRREQARQIARLKRELEQALESAKIGKYLGKRELIY